MRCSECAFYLKQFSFCTSGIIMFVDPEEGCISSPGPREDESPVKQLTPEQYKLLKKTDLVMRWASDGWLTDVGVRGMPRTEALIEIPHEAITFSFYDQLATGALKYSRNPENPAILVFTPLLNNQEFHIYKQWNADRFPPNVETKRIPAHAVPQHLDTFFRVARLIYYRHKDHKLDNKTRRIGEFLVMPGGIEQAMRLWQSRGYTAGHVTVQDRRVAYFGYNYGQATIVIFDGTDVPEDVFPDDLLEQVVVPSSSENELLGNLGLSNRCIVCGYQNDSSFDISYPCHFCLRELSSLVFRPEKSEG